MTDAAPQPAVDPAPADPPRQVPTDEEVMRGSPILPFKAGELSPPSGVPEADPAAPSTAVGDIAPAAPQDPAQPAPPPPAADPVVQPLTADTLTQAAKFLENQGYKISPPGAQPEPAGTATLETVGGYTGDQLNELLLSNPAEYTRVVVREATEQAQRAAQQITQQQANNQRQIEQFWVDFYAANTDLDRGKDHALVEQTLNAIYPQYSHLPVQTLASELSRTVRQNISTVVSRFGGPAAPQQPARPVGEMPSPAHAPAAPAAPTPDAGAASPGSISEAIQQSRRRMLGGKAA